MFALACSNRESLSLRYRRQSLFLILLVGLLFIGFPTHFKHRAACCRELRTVADTCELDRFILVRRSRCTDQLCCDQRKDILFTRRQRRKVSRSDTACGDNCMMPRYLSIVDNLRNIGSMRNAKPEIGITELCHIKCRLRHIIAEILAVSTRISDELSLIERLRIVECLLCRIAESLVCFSLKRGQVIELRSFIGLDLTLDRTDSDRVAVTGRNKCISGIFIINSRRRKNKVSAVQVNSKILLLHKAVYLGITLNDHCKCRCLNTPDVELTAVANGKQPRTVHSHKPVSPCTGIAC